MTCFNRAFKSSMGVQRNLTNIEFGLGLNATIEAIGSEPFADLPSLQTLSFSGQRINSIKSFAFKFNSPSNKTLNIDFTGNHLNGSSFESEAFVGANRFALSLMISKTDIIIV